MALEMADDKPSTGEPDNVIMRREIPKFDILYEECDEGTELNSRVVYRHDGIKEQVEDESDPGIKLVDERICLETTAFEYPEDKATGVTDMDNACCVQELATDTQILNTVFLLFSAPGRLPIFEVFGWALNQAGVLIKTYENLDLPFPAHNRTLFIIYDN